MRVVAVGAVLHAFRSVDLLAQVLGFLVTLDARIEYRLLEQMKVVTPVHFMAFAALPGGNRTVPDVITEVAGVTIAASLFKILERLHVLRGVMARAAVA